MFDVDLAKLEEVVLGILYRNKFKFSKAIIHLTPPQQAMIYIEVSLKAIRKFYLSHHDLVRKEHVKKLMSTLNTKYY